MSDQKKNQIRPADRVSDTKSWKLTDAKANLSRVVEAALSGKPQRIVRAGRDAVLVVEEQAYERALTRHRSAVELFSKLRGAGLTLERDGDLGRETSL